MRERRSAALLNLMVGFLCVLALGLVLSGISFAQIKSSTIVGTVTDPSGAVVPDANVTVINQETNVATTTVSDKSGTFTVPYLPPGTYTVNVEKSGTGLAKFSATNISVVTGQTVKIAAAMTMGSSVETVNVSATAVELQTSSATVQGITNEITIDAIPNLTHNAFNYAALQAGVVPRGLFGDTQSTTSWGIGIDGRRQASAVGIGGGAAFSNDIQLDGVSIQGSAWNETAVLPNMDSLQEVRAITNNYSAEYGRAQGVVVFTTKSGTNQFHGSAGYRLRNDALNANSFLNNFQGIKRPPFKSNSFSGAIGGPVFKDKTFFFVSYEGLRFHKALQYTRTVPTDQERLGNFCQTMVGTSAAPVPLKIYDPFLHVTPPTGTSTTYTRSQLPCDLRTSPAGSAQLDPFGMAIINAYPRGNQAPDNALLQTNNFFLQAKQPFVKDVVNSRLDHHFGKHYLYGTYGLQKGSIHTPRSYGSDNQYYSPLEFVGNQQKDNNWYTALGDTVVISPTLVLDARVGLNRIEADNASDEFPGYDYGQFGISPLVSKLNVIPGVPPNFNPSGAMSQNIINALNNTSSIHKHERQTNTDANGGLTRTRGRWTHKFGGTYRVLLSNYIDVDNSVSINTSPDFTRLLIRADGSGATASGSGVGSASDLSTQGFSIASMALGAGNLAVSPGFTLRLALAQKYYALYSQNDWRATDKLTLNLGLRWDVQPGPTDRFNRLSSIDLNAREPLFGTRGAIVFPGRTTDSPHMWETDYKNFGPRLGAAYQLSQNMVVRGGFGITYVPSNTGFNDGPGFYGAQPFTTAVTGQPYGTNPQGVVVGKFYNDSSNTTNPNAVVDTVVVGPGADPNNPAIYGGQRRFPTNFKNGYVEQWNVFWEKSFGANWLLSAGYLGSRGRHLEVTFVPTNSIQAIDPAQLSAWRDAYIATGKNPGVTSVCNPFQNQQTCVNNANGTVTASGPLIAYGNGNIRNRSLTLLETMFPYPLEGDNIHLSNGTSDYKALQLGLTHRFAAGFQLGANYTWSRLMAISRYNAQTNQGYGDYGANNGTNNYYPYVRPEQFKLNNQISTNDIPHRLTVNWVYDLPVGRGKWLDTQGGFLNSLLGGWRLAGNFLVQSGFVEPLANGGNNTGTLGVNNPLNNLPDRVPGQPLEVPKALQHWYDGKTSVMLPDGRMITPCRGCFLKYNIDAFAGRTITTATGSVLADNFWYGNAQPSYDDLRSASRWNVNLTVAKNFKLGEKYNLSLAAQATNLFNHTQFRPNINTAFGATATAANSATGLQLGQLLDVANTWGAYQLPINNASGNNAGGQAIYDARQIELVLHFTF
jgi:hypothetical protein